MKQALFFKIVKYLSLVLVLLGVSTYFQRYPTGDDAWFAEQSYWLAKTGIVRSNFFLGVLDWDKQIFVSHKLFILLGSCIIKSFGVSLIASKSISLFFSLVLFLFLVKYFYDRNVFKSNWYNLLFLLFGNILFVKMSFENRPELMVLTFGFLSFYFLQHGNKRYVWFAGLFAGLSALSHLNGIIYILAGCMLLLYTSNWRKFFYFSIASGITFAFYFFDIIYFSAFEVWGAQFKNDPAVFNSIGILAKLKVLAKFPSIFYSSPEQAAPTLLFIVLLWLNRSRISMLDVSLKVYSVSLFISFWLISKSATGHYQLLFFPFMLILIIELLTLEFKKDKISKLVVGTMFIYSIVGFVGAIQVLYKIHSSEYLPTKYAAICKDLPKNSVGLVPLEFYFNQYENHQQLYCLENNWPIDVYGKDMSTVSELGENAYAKKIDFILINKSVLRKASNISAKSNVPHYRIAYSNGNILYFKRDDR